MNNKEIIKYLEKELDSFTNFYWEIKENKDYVIFIESLNKFSHKLGTELWNPLWISITDILKDKEEVNKVLKQLNHK